MLLENRQINLLSVVIVGDFNPVIVQPFWLASKKLIKEEEATNAKVELIHNEFVRFQIGDWLHIQVTRERLEVKTAQEPYFDAVRDLLVSIFSYLKETPLKAFGVNHTRHYSIEEKQYYDLGDNIAPLSNWSSLFKKPEVLSVEILQKGETNRPGGEIRLKIQPSDALKKRFSFMTHINDHSVVNDARVLTSLLKDNWQSTFELANNVEQTMEKLISR
jgi:hypothetical protein